VTPDEKQIITDFVQRVVRGDQPAPAPSPWNRAPAAPPPPREPLDPEADALLKQLQDQYPEARYRLAQLAFVQEHALAEAQNRIAQLEWEAQSRGQQGGLLGGLFGGNRPVAPPPQPVHAPGYRPGMFQQGGPGFLGSAARVAVGVAGGMLLGSAIASMLGMGGAAHAANPDALATSNPVEPGALDDGLAKQPAYDSSDVASADLSDGDSGGDDEMF
jgi:hypothetical protein